MARQERNRDPHHFHCFLPMAALLLAVSCVSSAFADTTITVAPDGSGNFMRLQDALASVPTTNTTPVTINIKPGTYAMSSISDQFKIVSPYITLNGLGSSPSDVVLTGNYNVNLSPNDKYGHATTVITADNFTARNITFSNTAGQNAGQSLAMYSKADRLAFYNCDFLGWQDTLRAEYGRQYFENCYVEGHVDFIYGHATAFFQNSSIYSKASGYLTAPDTLLAGDYKSKGFVFNQCTITGATANSATLGRPWNAGGLDVYENCKIGPVISPAGWTDVSGDGAAGLEFFAEYHSTDLNGNPVNVSQRVSWSKQLTDTQAQAYSLTNWLAGPDNWNPATAVPEPSTLALALPAITWWISRRRR